MPLPLPLAILPVALTLLAALTGAPAHAESLPQRNLLVEWRTSGQSEDARAGAGAGVTTTTRNVPTPGGGYTVSTTRRTETTVTFGAGSVQTQSSGQGQQQMLVLNGGQARLFVGESRPFTVWQWGWGTPVGQPTSPTAQPQAQAWGQTVFLDLGQGLVVRPSWPGGQAPVRVEFQATSAQRGTAYEPDGTSRRAEVASTLLVPLGQWLVVARSGQRTETDQAGTLSTRTLERQDSGVLEIRITAP